MIHTKLLSRFKNFIRKDDTSDDMDPEYKFCPRCDANLTLQKGYDNSLPYWICKGCGEMLINPEVSADDDIAWICDGCGTMLNIQPGFREDCGEWTCTECGHVNRIDESELYGSEDEYQTMLHNPYKGLTDEEILNLSVYEELENIVGRNDVILVRNRDTTEKYVKKLLTTYNKSVYSYLLGHPVPQMPKIIEMYESDNCLIVIEEFIPGKTVADLLEEGLIPERQVLHITKSACSILDALHNLPTPIIHRDVKPSNIIITPDNDVVLLDINVAKWFDPDKTDDTVYMGTRFYAAPEQAGYGLSASSAKSDIYAVGVLMNVMLTGDIPKHKKAEGDIRRIIERCISLDAKDRYTARELINEIDLMGGTDRE